VTMPSLAQPVAVITGAASGIGAACVERFRQAGWRTAGIDLHASNSDLVFRTDVSDTAGVGEAVSGVLAEFGQVDVAVSAVALTQQRWDRMLAVILGGTANLAAAVLPTMVARDRGSVIAISSELALAGSSTDLHYVAAKGAVLGLVKALAIEFAHTSIRINAVAPGPTDTPLLASDSMWRDQTYLNSLPLQRLVTPQEIAATVYYLATEAEMYCGEVLSPNAGAVI